jgi:hypothetical protein
MDYLFDLHARDPNAFWSALGTAVAAAVAVLAYLQTRKPKNGPSASPPAGNATVHARDITGQVVINTGAGNVTGVTQVNYTTEDKRQEWMVYEAAFLWHGLAPPGIEAHFQRMTRDIEETKTMLHGAINAGTLRAAREAHAEGSIARWVTRTDLRAYALSIGARPLFLFPEDR